MITITKRQAQVLDFIERQPIPPTLREIGAFMNIRSTNGVNDHLRGLERKGRLVPYHGMKTRQIAVAVPLTAEERLLYGLGTIHRCPTCGHVTNDDVVSVQQASAGS